MPYEQNEYQPNASETRVGRVQIATPADITAGRHIGSTGAVLVVPADLNGVGSGIVTSINGDATAAQTLTVGTAGGDFNIVDNGSGDHKFNLPTASGGTRGALSPTDWTTFNNKENALTFSTGLNRVGDTVSVVNDTTIQKIKVDKNGVLVSTRDEVNLIEGSNVSITVADNGGLNRADVTINSIPTASILSINGDATAAQTLTTGTTGTDFAIVDNGTGDHKFNLPTASAINRGALSSADWTNFNSKQPGDATLTALAGLDATPGYVVETAADTFTKRTITGSASRISVANGNAAAANTSIDIDAAYVGQTSITTLGTITTGTWNGTTIDVAHGGTGVTTVTGLLAGNGTTPLAGRTLVAPAAGITISNANGATANPTFALANDLAAVEGLATTGLAARTATDTWATRTIQPPAAGITVTNGGGVAGDPTLVLANDLAAVEGLGTTGIAVRTATDTWTTRTATGTANRITVTNGDGVAGNPTVDIAATYVGQTSITTLGTITTGVWNGSVIPLAFGGTNANLTASNGGIFYSTATAGAILSGTATAGQILRSGATAAPTWSTATYPATAGTLGNLLVSDGTNWVSTNPGLSQSSPADPATTTSATGVMMGLAGSITPNIDASVLIIISGDIDNNTRANGAQVQIRFGTGAAPVNGAALTGTTGGGLVKFFNADATGLLVGYTVGRYAFSLNAIVSMTSGVANWIDISLAALSGGTARVRDISISATEV